jgi:hypothetical protein
MYIQGNSQVEENEGIFCFVHFNVCKLFYILSLPTLDRMLLVKSIQNPSIFHKDLICAPMSRNYEVSLSMLMLKTKTQQLNLDLDFSC